MSGFPVEETMAEEDDKTAAGDDGAAAPAPGGTPRRAYSRPTLIEYGSVAKLTQGTRTLQSDAPIAGFRKICI